MDTNSCKQVSPQMLHQGEYQFLALGQKQLLLTPACEAVAPSAGGSQYSGSSSGSVSPDPSPHFSSMVLISSH